MTQQPDTSPDAPSVDFLVRLGGAMLAANYPIPLIRRMLKVVSERYGLNNQILLLPNFIQFGGSHHAAGTAVRVVRPEADLRYDQGFPLAALVADAQTGRVTAHDGLTELARIHWLPPRFPGWVSIIGYAIVSLSFAFLLQPTPAGLLAATGLGLMVGVLEQVGRIWSAIGQLLPVFGSLLVAFTAFGLRRLWHFGDDSLRDLLAPLTLYLPGVAITLSVMELTTKEVVSGSARLIFGFMRLAQLTFGILVAAQVLGVTAAELNATQLNKLGAWAPWAGVVLYTLGVLLYFGPPNRFLPALLAAMLVTYAGQVAANALFGSYTSGFGGGLALMVCAVAMSQRPNAPPAAAVLLPGFWLLVPGALGLVGVTQLVDANTGASVAVTVVSMISIALGMQTGMLLWCSARQLAGDPGLV